MFGRPLGQCAHACAGYRDRDAFFSSSLPLSLCCTLLYKNLHFVSAPICKLVINSYVSGVWCICVSAAHRKIWQTQAVAFEGLSPRLRFGPLARTNVCMQVHVRAHANRRCLCLTGRSEKGRREKWVSACAERSVTGERVTHKGRNPAGEVVSE